jgi:hypothetical protein
MAEIFELETRRSIRTAMVLDSYAHDRVRISDSDISGYDWLVSTHKGLFAVNLAGAKCVAHGWFFGICRFENHLYLFENCAQRDRTKALGRLIKLSIVDNQLSEPVVIAKGLDANCHQIRVIDKLLCVVDTANQAALRYDLSGCLVDVKRPFPIAPVADRTGAYLHINSIAKVGSRIAVLLHNGRAIPEKCSELAWLDSDWNVQERVPLDGHFCHDIVEDVDGVLWYSASKTGELMASDGRRLKVDNDRMTRGLVVSSDHIVVGLSGFGARESRDALPGSVVIFDRNFARLAEISLGGPPVDIIAI